MARTASAAFLSAAKSEARQHCVKVLIQYADGTSQTLTDLTDFMGIKIDDSCSDSSKFVIGSAIINEAVIRLNNREGKFTGKDFFGAKIDVKVGFVIDGTPEYVDMGSYLVDEPVSPGERELLRIGSPGGWTYLQGDPCGSGTDRGMLCPRERIRRNRDRLVLGYRQPRDHGGPEQNHLHR